MQDTAIATVKVRVCSTPGRELRDLYTTLRRDMEPTSSDQATKDAQPGGGWGKGRKRERRTGTEGPWCGDHHLHAWRGSDLDTQNTHTNTIMVHYIHVSFCTPHTYKGLVLYTTHIRGSGPVHHTNTRVWSCTPHMSVWSCTPHTYEGLVLYTTHI